MPASAAGVLPGSPLPLGIKADKEGVNFAVFSRHASRVRLELFKQAQDAAPARSIDLDAALNRTGDVWHVWVKGIASGQLYAYRMDGPYEPSQGQRFNFKRLLLDPFAASVSGVPDWDFAKARGFDGPPMGPDLSPSKQDNAGSMPKGIIVDRPFDWEGDRPPKHPWSKTVIYEAHVRGLTMHPSSGVGHPGTYRGLIEKIPYLKDLGVSAVELMPVQEFNSHGNYWGYDPVVFCAPKASYSSAGGMGQQATEFKEMVRALHQAGLELILDVVFNHTAEGNENGPTLCHRGIDNAIFYTLADDKRHYRDFAGTGNSVNANHPVVRDHILAALRFWMVEMHVDGFRFDLASVLGRDGMGRLMPDAPLLERIAEDPILRDLKLIAEAWDAAGAYEVGSFSQRRWAEWNGRYRDDVRAFWRGDQGLAGAFASRLCGSYDIYAQSGKGPEASINFVTCHDGLTLQDLAGQGPQPAQQIKNYLLTLLVSRRVPMLLAGDEMRRSQGGNANAYDQDNARSWLDWSGAEKHRDILRFTRGLIALRRAHPVLSAEQFYSGEEIAWHGPRNGPPAWADPECRALACFIREPGLGGLFLIFNSSQVECRFHLPALPAGQAWFRAADSALESPADMAEAGKEPRLETSGIYGVKARSCVILLAREQK